MITTFQQHILQQQREVPYASGDFSWLLSGITLAAKMIEAKIRCAGLCQSAHRSPEGLGEFCRDISFRHIALRGSFNLRPRFAARTPQLLFLLLDK